MDAIFEVHHGGYMQFYPETKYLEGRVDHICLESDQASYNDLLNCIKLLGYSLINKVVYKMPGQTMPEGIREVINNEHVLEMVERGIAYGVLEVFVEAEPSDLLVPYSSNGVERRRKEAGSQATSSRQEVKGCEGSGEDEDHFPVEEIETEDDLEDNELTDDEEYLEARRNRRAKRETNINVSNEPLPLHQEVTEATTATNMIQKERDKEEDPVSVYEESEVSVQTLDSDEEGHVGRRMRKKKKKYPSYEPTSDHKQLLWSVGMRFASGIEFKQAVQQYAVENGLNLRWVRSSKKRMEARCNEGCPWKLYASWMPLENTFVLKRLGEPHKCSRNLKNRQATTDWIAKTYLDRFRRNPNWTVKELEEDMRERFHLRVNKMHAYRARRKALNLLRGSIEQHYALLRSYRAELKRRNVEGTFEWELDMPVPQSLPVFRRFYVGFFELRKGFLEGCRPIVGLDGSSLKTTLGGELLYAVGRDGNNQMYPIAWAVVEEENESSWTWFIQLLANDLRITDGYGWTSISDQQKGLMTSLKKLVPHAEHRNCARHIYSNWNKNYKGKAFKQAFWKAARSTHEASFREAIEEMKILSKDAAQSFLDMEPANFCKAFIRTLPKCDIIDNNMCETFNGFIFRARAKPIIDLLEDIRSSLMERMHTKSHLLDKLTDSIMPRIKSKLEKAKVKSKFCIPKPAVGHRFEVTCGDDRYVVDVHTMSCTCRDWDLTGIPCCHAISCILWLGRDPEAYVDNSYKREKYMKAYQHSLQPLNGQKMWPPAEGQPILPPPFKKVLGRPKRARHRDEDEQPANSRKLSKIGVQMSCRKCHKYGHNIRSCEAREAAKANLRAKGDVLVEFIKENESPITRSRSRAQEQIVATTSRASNDALTGSRSNASIDTTTSEARRTENRENRKMSDQSRIPSISDPTATAKTVRGSLTCPGPASSAPATLCTTNRCTNFLREKEVKLCQTNMSSNSDHSSYSDASSVPFCVAKVNKQK